MTSGDVDEPVTSEIDRLTIRALSLELDSFVGACLDERGDPKAPDRKALMRARAALPKYCRHTLIKDKPVKS